MAENLTQRGAVYYARVATPQSLQLLRLSTDGTRGKKDVWKSLGTKDLPTAKRRLATVLADIYAAFAAEEAELRHRGARNPTKPSEHDLERASFEFIHQELHLDEVARANRPSAALVEAKRQALVKRVQGRPTTDLMTVFLEPGGLLEWEALAGVAEADAERRTYLANELRQHLTENQFVLVDWAIRDIAQRNAWVIEHESADYKTLGRRLLRGWLAALETAAKRDQGVYDQATVHQLAPTAPARHAPEPASQNPRKGEGVRDYFDAYLKERKAQLSHNGKIDARATLRQFIDCAGDKAVTSYGKADMTAFKRMLLRAPARTEKLYPGLPLPKAVERNRQDGHPVLSANSIRNKLSVLSAFGKWLEENVDGVDASNFRTSLPPKKDGKRMEPFNQAEIASILNARAFTGCESEKNQLAPGEYRIRDWRYWLPLLAAFTGARLNEITQLKVKDVVCIDGIWVLEITDEGTQQSLKTNQSKRRVPVHPQLIELGFLALRDEAERGGKADLFHAIQVDRDGRRSTGAGKWFRKFLTRIGVKGKDDLGAAHRWRHTLTDALRRGGVEDYEAATVLGHKIDVAKMTGHYGREVTMTLAQRRDLIAKAEYPSVDFLLLK